MAQRARVHPKNGPVFAGITPSQWKGHLAIHDPSFGHGLSPPVFWQAFGALQLRRLVRKMPVGHSGRRILIHRPVYTTYTGLVRSKSLAVDFMHWHRHVIEELLPLYEIFFFVSLHSNQFVEGGKSISVRLLLRRFVSRSHVTASQLHVRNCFASTAVRTRVFPIESCPVSFLPLHRTSDPASTLQHLATPFASIRTCEPLLDADADVDGKLSRGAWLLVDGSTSNDVQWCGFHLVYIRFASRTVRFRVSSCRSASLGRLGEKAGADPPFFADTPSWESWENEGEKGCGVWSGRGAEGKAVPRTVDWKGVDPVRRGLKGGSPGFEPGFDRMEKEHDTLASVEPRPSRKDAPFSRSFSLPASPEDRGVDRPSACQGGLWGIEGPSRSPSPRRCESEGHVRIVRGGKGRGTTNRVDSIPERTRERERRVDQVRDEREKKDGGVGERCHVDPGAWEGTKGKGEWKSLQGDVERALE